MTRQEAFDEINRIQDEYIDELILLMNDSSYDSIKMINFTSATGNIVERLNEYSEQTRIPKTAIVEFALIEYLDKVAPKKAKELLPEAVD